jgi:hypothetical protein
VSIFDDTNSGYSGFSVNTDASGNIIAWGIYAGNGIWAYYDPPNLTQEGINGYNGQYYGAEYEGYAVGGTWTIATTSTPEPSSLALFCTGVGGLSAMLRRKQTLRQPK